MTVISILLGVNASLGLVIGLVLFRAHAIVLASPLVALFSVAVLCHHRFGPVREVLILIGALTALQGFYLVGAFMRYLTMDDARDRS